MALPKVNVLYVLTFFFFKILSKILFSNVFYYFIFISLSADKNFRSLFVSWGEATGNYR